MWFLPLQQTPVGAAFIMPAFEVKERKDAYVFRADLPGVKEEELDISLTGNRLTVSGQPLPQLAEGEESPGSTGQGCWVTPRGGDPTDSATETYRGGHRA